MDLLIFDMDGVLIDVSRSYLRAIQKTVQLYLETCFGLKRTSEDLIGEKEIFLFKSVKGFNSDWDVTHAILLYLLSLSNLPPEKKEKRFSSCQEIVEYLRKKASSLVKGKPFLSKNKSLPSFLEKVKKNGGGLKGVERSLHQSWRGWIYGSGDIQNENLVKRIFQEIYLGDRFTPCYHLPRLFYKGKGLYLEERLIISKKILALLKKSLYLGIASGRTRFEAEMALSRFRIDQFFESVVTLNECEEEEQRIFQTLRRRIKLSKPHPYSILKAIQEIGLPHPRCGYVGDVVDDMLAARRAKKKVNLIAIGFVGGTYGKKRMIKESLLKAGADWIIDHPNQLLQLTSFPFQNKSWGLSS